MLYRNVAGQKIHVYAYDSTTGAAKTGDASNITAYVSLDGTANALDDTNPAEVDPTNMPGVYVFDLAQAETDCNAFALYAKSVTSNVRIEPLIGFTTGAANSLSVNAGQIGGTTQTGRDLGAGVLLAATTHTGAVIPTVSTLTGHTAQTGDAYAIVNNGTYGNSALKTTLSTTGVALTSGERTTLAAALEAAIINELDGTAVMQAIADLIASDMTTTDLTVAAIATAVRDAILNRVLSGNHDTAGSTGKVLQDIGSNVTLALADTNELQTDWANGGRLDLLVDAIKAKTDLGLVNTTWTDTKSGYLDAAVSSRGTGTALDAAGVRSAIGLGSANLDTQLGAITVYVDCLPATWVTVPTAAANATAVRSELGTELGRLDLAVSTRAAATTALTNATWTDAKAGYLDAAVSSRGTGAALDAAGVRNAVGLSSANLDTQIGLLATATNLAAAKTILDKFNTMVVLDGAVYDFTPEALAAAPTTAAAPTVEQIRAEMDSNSTKLTAIKAKTDLGLVNTTWTDTKAGYLDAAVSTAGGSGMTAEDIADAMLDRDMGVGTDSGSETVRTVRQALRFLRNRWYITGNMLTVTKENDTDISWESELVTQNGAQPVVGSNPVG